MDIRIPEKMTLNISKTNKKYNKFKSTKLWITLWACAMISFIVIAGKTDFTSIATALCVMPVAYSAANVVQKKMYNQQGLKEGE
jgi:hypothetical protein